MLIQVSFGSIEEHLDRGGTIEVFTLATVGTAQGIVQAVGELETIAVRRGFRDKTTQTDVLPKHSCDFSNNGTAFDTACASLKAVLICITPRSGENQLMLTAVSRRWMLNCRRGRVG